MAIDVKTLALAKKYTKDSLTGAGALKGDKGDTGATPIISATATVDDSSGTPAVTVTKSGTETSPEFSFAFTGLKGEQGAASVSEVKAETITNTESSTKKAFIEKVGEFITGLSESDYVVGVVAQPDTYVSSLWTLHYEPGPPYYILLNICLADSDTVSMRIKKIKLYPDGSFESYKSANLGETLQDEANIDDLSYQAGELSCKVLYVSN